MISFVKKTAETPPSPAEADENRFEQIRKTAAEKYKKSDTSRTRHRAQQTSEDDRPV
jgi:hypothetical protein